MILVKFIKWMSVMTVLVLVYVHMQMQIIDLAYQGNIKEQHIRQLMEERGDLTYAVLRLQSANHLGVKMLANNSNMQFVHADQIVRISTAEEIFPTAPRNSNLSLETNENSLLRFISFGTNAEAGIK